MRLLFRSAGVMVFLVVAACAATPPTGQQMRALWVGKDLYLRNFWGMDQFQVGRNGVPLGTLTQVPWEMAQIHIDSVEAQGSSILVRGTRLVQVYNPGTKDFTAVPWPQRKIAIRIEADLATLSAAEVTQLAERLFFRDFAEVKAELPSYWQPFFTGQQPDCGPLGKGGARGVTAPQWERKPDPDYSAAARVLQVQGSVAVGACISAQGGISRAWIVRPLGAGLDGKAIAAVMGWRFTPAHNAAGQAIATKITSDINFRLY